MTRISAPDDIKRESGELPRVLSLFDSAMINAGSMIGSGIFIVPAAVAASLGATAPIVLVWIAGGLVSLAGAAAVAELGAMRPKAGGQYVYLSEAFSPLVGFLYGWAAFLVINTGSIAAVAVTGAAYVGWFLPLSDLGVQFTAAGAVWVLTAVNCVGIRPGAVVQNVVTVLKIAALAALPALALLLPGGSAENLLPLLPSGEGPGLAAGLGAAMIAVLWSYDGWIEITYVAGEVRDPGRNLHRSLLWSTAGVTVLYSAAALAFVYLLSAAGMTGSPLVAADAASVLLGPAGASVIAGAVILSTFGAANGFILTCPRIQFQMAKEGYFFRWYAAVHPRFGTPVPALLAQAVLATALILTGTFRELTTWVVFASFLFYGMTAAGVFVLRWRIPSAARPWRAPGHPATTALFLLFAGWLTLDTILSDPRSAAFGAGVILSGIPAYLYWKRRRGF